MQRAGHALDPRVADVDAEPGGPDVARLQVAVRDAGLERALEARQRQVAVGILDRERQVRGHPHHQVHADGLVAAPAQARDGRLERARGPLGGRDPDLPRQGFAFLLGHGALHGDLRLHLHRSPLSRLHPHVAVLVLQRDALHLGRQRNGRIERALDHGRKRHGPNLGTPVDPVRRGHGALGRRPRWYGFGEISFHLPGQGRGQRIQVHAGQVGKRLGRQRLELRGELVQLAGERVQAAGQLIEPGGALLGIGLLDRVERLEPALEDLELLLQRGHPGHQRLYPVAARGARRPGLLRPLDRLVLEGFRSGDGAGRQQERGGAQRQSAKMEASERRQGRCPDSSQPRNEARPGSGERAPRCPRICRGSGKYPSQGSSADSRPWPCTPTTPRPAPGRCPGSRRGSSGFR